MLRMEVFPTVISGGVDISDVPGCHLLRKMRFPRGSQKLPQGMVSLLSNGRKRNVIHKSGQCSGFLVTDIF